MMNNWHMAFPDFKYHVEAMLAEDDVVAVRTTFTGTHTGDFRFGPGILPPSGKSLRIMEMFFFRVANDKIVEIWASWDRLRVYEQLGIQPTAA
jgi:predicted ester cyclase